MSKKLLLAKEVHKHARKRFEKSFSLTKGINDLWAADPIDMKKFSKESNGYMHTKNVIDTSSKFAWAIQIKSKDGVTVSKDLKNIIRTAKAENHKPPNLLHTDIGTEFENKHFMSFGHF